jgi:hypothetical protein
MSKPNTGPRAGAEICKALGLDPSLVRNIDLSFHVGEVAIASVDMFLCRESMEPITKILKAYRWEAEE